MKLFQRISGVLVAVGVAASVAGAKLDKYEDPPAKGPHEVILERLEPSERHFYKAEILSKSMRKEESFVKDGIEVKVLGIKRENDLLTVVVHAEKDGQVLKVNNPLHYKNPPLKVSTGKFHRELVDGEEVDIPNTIEDTRAALQEIIIQAVKLQNKEFFPSP